METRAHHILIGLFTVLVAGAALLFALWLGRPAVGKESKRYDIFFSESVTGLSVGSAVRYSGIQVGAVESLDLDPNDPRRVRARIQVGAATPIKQDTRAQLFLANITGANEIQLRGGSPESPPLTATDEDIVPTIPADPSPLAQIAGGGEELMHSVTQLISRANQLLSPANAASISATLAHLQRITGTVANRSDELDAAIGALSEASINANRAVEQAARLIAQVDGMVDTQGETMLASATAAMASLERTSAELERLLDDNATALTGGIQGFSMIGPALQELRATLASLGGIARRLEEDPAGYLLGRDNVQEFQP